ncbi:fatty acid synthase-like, partial [Anoplophora glabripennis]|uniref:fatty acid synthase-like n=1 Tax=Anoplophora glabripennis TaxID=217634 RepID=UPI000C786B7F
MESGFIPPNLNFTTPRKEIKGIVEGRMKVVVDKMPFEDDRSLIGVSSFGFGGSNCHVLLKRNPKEKINKGLPEDNLPRLVCVSGRTTEAVNALLDAVSRNGLDAEFVGLLHEGYRRNVEDHLYRGYAIVTKTGEISRSLKCSPGSCKPLYIVFGELDNWRNIGHQLMVLPTFSAFIQRLQNNLSTKGVHIWDLLLNRRVGEKNSSQVLGSIVVQAGIIEVLNLLCIKPKAYLSYSFGGLLSSYCNDLLSLEETVNCALVIDEA